MLGPRGENTLAQAQPCLSTLRLIPNMSYPSVSPFPFPTYPDRLKCKGVDIVRLRDQIQTDMM